MKYEINSNTLAIIAEKKSSRIIETDNEFTVSESSYEIMDRSCRFFGSSYFGRTVSTRDLTGMTYKVPILLVNNIIFFPTSSPKEEGCSFILFNKIESIKKLPYNKTLVTFVNNKSVVLPYSYRTLENQIYRSSRLFYVIEQHLQTLI